MENTNYKVEETFDGLPELCFCKYETTGETVLIKRGVRGYFPQDELKDRNPDVLNEIYDVSKAQSEAMKKGSLFGWHVPASNPKMYDENGKPVKG